MSLLQATGTSGTNVQSGRVGMTSGELGEVLMGPNKIPDGELEGLLHFSGRLGWKVGFGQDHI